MRKRGLLVTAALVAAFGAAGCSEVVTVGRHINGTDLAGLRRTVAAQFWTVPQRVACRSGGAWEDLAGRSRNISYSFVQGGGAWERGCYDSDSHADLTLAIRSTDGDKRECAGPLALRPRVEAGRVTLRQLERWPGRGTPSSHADSTSGILPAVRREAVASHP